MRYLIQRFEGIGLLLVGVIAISFAAPLFKLAAPTHPLVASAIRLSCAAIMWGGVYGLQCWHTQRTPIRLTPRAIKYAAFCGLCYGLHFGSWVWSLGLTSVLTSATLVTTTPLMLGLIAMCTGRDLPSRTVVISGVVAAMGVSLFALEDLGEQGTIYGDVLALLGAAAMVPYLLLSRKLGHELMLVPFSLITTSVGASSLWMVSWCTLTTEQLTVSSSDAFLALLGAALIPQMIGHSALTVSLKRFTPTEVGLATLIEPVGAATLAWLMIGEPTTWLGVLASLMILSAVVMALYQAEVSR